jgi:hypothetical protein
MGLQLAANSNVANIVYGVVAGLAGLAWALGVLVVRGRSQRTSLVGLNRSPGSLPPSTVEKSGYGSVMEKMLFGRHIRRTFYFIELDELR